LDLLLFIAGVAVGAVLILGAGRLWWGRRDRVESCRLRAEASEAGEKLTELSTLTGGLAHEIRNPLSTLKVNLQLLAEDWRDAVDSPHSELCRRSLNKIDVLRTEADRLGKILDDFLKYIGRQELHRTRADLNVIVEEMLIFFRPQAESHQVQVRSVLSPDALSCDIDESLIKQAILNLFVNAQQAMPDGGELMVRTGSDDRHQAVVEVTDTGCGIPQNDREKVFQAYYSTKRDGTGLGLPMTRQIVRAHGGTIELQSEVGRGSRFTVRLPMS